MIVSDTIIPCVEKSEEGHKVVAVIGWNNDFSAYQYYNGSSDDECASRGDKISKEQARRLFPELKDYYYRS